MIKLKVKCVSTGLLWCLFFMLTACGGGGGGSGSGDNNQNQNQQTVSNWDQMVWDQGEWQ